MTANDKMINMGIFLENIIAHIFDSSFTVDEAACSQYALSKSTEGDTIKDIKKLLLKNLIKCHSLHRKSLAVLASIRQLYSPLS